MAMVMVMSVPQLVAPVNCQGRVSKAKRKNTLDARSRTSLNLAHQYFFLGSVPFFVLAAVLGVAMVRNNGHVFCFPACLSGSLIWTAVVNFV